MLAPFGIGIAIAIGVDIETDCDPDADPVAPRRGVQNISRGRKPPGKDTKTSEPRRGDRLQ
jgi:hypothetical protein